MKKIKSLVLGFAILCSTLFFANSVQAKDVVVDSEMNYSDFIAQYSEAIANNEDITIDGNNTAVIKASANSNYLLGSSNTDYSGTLTVKNITFDANDADKSIIAYISAPNATIVFDNVTFQNYQKAGIWLNSVKSIVVKNSTFDAAKTSNMVNEGTLITRSAAGLDFSLGDGSKSKFSLEKIEITNNTFKNVSSEGATAGAIKIKVKDKSNLNNFNNLPTFVINNNVFENNGRDMVFGTDAPASGTTQQETSSFSVKVSNNGNVKVLDNSKSSASLTTYDYDFIANFGLNLIDTIVDDKLVGSEPEDITGLVEAALDSDLTGIIIEYKDYTITVDLTNFSADEYVKDLSLNFSTDPTEELKTFAKEGNIYITSNESGALPGTITVTKNYPELANKTLYLYYYNPNTKKLEYVSDVKVNDKGNVSFELQHYSSYILSEEKLVSDTSSTDNSTTVANPNTGDNIAIYMILAIMSVILGTVVAKNKLSKVK